MNILIIRLSSLGDVVHALPTLAGLRREFPAAHIGWVIDARVSEILEGHPDIDDLIVVDRRALKFAIRNGPGRLKALHKLLRLRHDLRAGGWDLCLDLHGLFLTGLMAWASGAPVRRTWCDARIGARVFSEVAGQPSPSLHRAERFLQTAFPNGRIVLPKGQVPVSEEMRDAVDRLLASKGFDPKARLIAMAPGTTRPLARWPVGYFADVARVAIEKWKLQVSLVGSSQEHALCEEIAHRFGRGCVNLAGATTIKLMTALLQKAVLCIGNDSGPTHIADVVGTPCVGLYQPPSVSLARTLGLQSRVIAEEACSNWCENRVGATHCACLESLGPQRVVQFIEENFDWVTGSWSSN